MWFQWVCCNWMPRPKVHIWWIGSGVSANFTGCVVYLATWMDSCCKVWQLWRQKINKITRSFMKPGLAGKTGEWVAVQDLSRSGRYWQWLHLGWSKTAAIGHNQSSRSGQPALAKGLVFRCLQASLIGRLMAHQQGNIPIRRRCQCGGWGPTLCPLLKRGECWQWTSLRNVSK